LGCVFCDIVRGTAPSHIIYEDDRFIAILDKYPISIGHTLVMPKKHLERVKDLTQKEFSDMYMRIYALNSHITSTLNVSSSHISINDGRAANQLIPHLHVHIIPRNENDNAAFTARRYMRPQEMEEIRRRLEVKRLPVDA